MFTVDVKQQHNTGFSLTPYLESFTPSFGLGTPVFPRISSNLHCGTPTFSKRCLCDSYFQNPSENPDNNNSGDSNKQCKAPTVFIAQRMTHQMCKMYGKYARHCRHVYKGGQLSSLPVCFLDPFKIGSSI